jgi:uncharacterized protein YndB with AHSA1/START domain
VPRRRPSPRRVPGDRAGPPRLVYTFVWEEPDPDDRETVVALTFLRAPEGTTVVLDQGLFESEERYAVHEAGWRETLERLARFLG